MFLVDQLVLLAAVLVLIGILSSKLSARVGLPVLVLFLAIGMLAGEDGPGGIEFDSFIAAHAIGTLALGIILFDGGLQTRLPAIKAAWKPAALLATVGVGVTAVITGLAASSILDVSLTVGLLLGSIVASTDAAAVFSVLRSQGLDLRPRLAATLEVESGSNDPMAIFLTIGFLQILTGQMEPGIGLVRLFVLQMGVGALAGMVLGNSRVVFQRGTFHFMDGLAWVGQITMFVVLGLLSTPSEVVPVAGRSLLIAAVLILVARPVAVVPLLLPFRFDWREHLLISWVGLKGAVPIILATFPMIFGLPEGRLLFDVVFFVVLVSATLQGWTLAPLAARLGLQEHQQAPPQVSLELLALHDVNAEIVDYPVSNRSTLVSSTIRDLRLPDGALVALISRGRQLVAPRGSTRLEAGDHLFVIVPGATRAEVDRALGR